MKRVRRVWWMSCLAMAMASPLDGQAADRAGMLAEAERCRSILRKSLVEFYIPDSVDPAGGYFESLRGDEFAATGEKFLVHQARQLWFFSTLAAAGIDREQTLAAAAHGYAFLHRAFLDREHGGYFSKVSDDGSRAVDSRKHAYLNAFALYALSAYSKASGNEEALEAARALFRLFEEKMYDPEFGGYREFFHRDWRPVTEPRERGYVGATGHKTYNTHLHILEAFAELLRVWPSDAVRKRLGELLVINTSSVRYARADANVDAWHRDWRVVEEARNLRASYGHDVECAWLVLDAAEALGMPRGVLRNWAVSLTQTSLKFGYDRGSGGFFSGGPLNGPADDRKKVWWVQAEALVGMLEMHRLTGEGVYWDAFRRTLEFVDRHQVAVEGGWWATREPDGSAVPGSARTGPWHAAYHGGRAMLRCAERLEAMAKEN